MKKLGFVKMTGAGNDFIIIEAKAGLNYKILAEKICDRTNGLGADGLLVLDKSKKTDYRMRIINADSSEAEMCGNGARCLAAYIQRFKKPSKKVVGIETIAGIVLAEAAGEMANVRLSNPKDYRRRMSVTIHKRKLKLDAIDTGVPHAVIFVNGLKDIDVFTLGRLIRFHRAFKPRGTNVNFVEQMNSQLIAVRTYERGVEDETKACGTGSVAAALTAYQQFHRTIANKTNVRMKVQTQNKDILEVCFDIVDGQSENVWLKGPAKFIAEGTYFLK